MVEEIKETYLSEEDIPASVNRNGMLVGKIYYKDILALPDDVISYCAAYPNETLIIHGTGDLLVPYEYSVLANEAYPNSSLLTIENGSMKASVLFLPILSESGSAALFYSGSL